MEPLLQAQDLRVEYRLERGGSLAALRGVDFAIEAGECVGVLGESGCGKSTLAAAIPGLLARNAAITCGSIRFEGRELIGLGERELQAVRGAGIETIYQEPALALNPVLRVGRQVEDVARAHPGVVGIDPREAACGILKRVGLANMMRAYPHQLSGGQRQRVVIAQALVCRPKLVIADEPTSSLDSTTQAGILALLSELRQEMRVTLLLISHDPAVLANTCDRVLVMYAGRIVEQGALGEVYGRPLHPYTAALLSLLAGSGNGKGRLASIPGAPPDMAHLPPGCSFEPRCADRMESCTAREPQAVAQGERSVRCFKHG